jgi:NADPH:quinone reductase-like Zn-dependent oxidoreductase
VKAVVIRKYGSPEVLEIDDIPKPSISGVQVLIRVFYTSVNPIDWKIRNGSFKFLTGFTFPITLGYDVAGEIADIGRGVKGFDEGDRVFCMLNMKNRGSYAEYARAEADSVAFMPEDLSYREAAAVPLAGLTAYQALHRKGRVRKGDAVLINGASGGVGSFAVQIARAEGAMVTAVCGSRNAELVKSLGADRVIDYQQEDLTAIPERFDIIFDSVGNLSFPRISACLRDGGRYITTLPYGLPNVLSFVLSPVLRLFADRKSSSFIGVRPSSANLRSLSALISQKRIVPLIDREYPFEEIREAHAYSQTGHARGKIVIRI